MHKRTTERFHPAASGIDALPYPEIAGHLLTAQMDALSAVEPAIEDLSKAATLMARTVRNGDRLIYAAAGSSGLMAAADALELPGTFGIPADRIRIFMAGGLPTGSEMPGATEDDAQSAEAAAQNISAGDVVIAVSASGSTPYAVALARAAREAGAKTICIANNSDAPLFEQLCSGLQTEISGYSVFTRTFVLRSAETLRCLRTFPFTSTTLGARSSSEYEA